MRLLKTYIFEELHPDDKGKVKKQKDALTTTTDNDSTWWTKWVTPAVSAPVMTFYISRHIFFKISGRRE
uniref:Uncharacterized protein n=1 Tax=Vombatus ursinus TaxID=29139 RepID=A0A4X2LQY8_VOMUR